jgi:hypothetical protein
MDKAKVALEENAKTRAVSAPLFRDELKDKE